MNDPIVVWPPGTTYLDCSSFGNFYDCTWSASGYEYAAQAGALICCPIW